MLLAQVCLGVPRKGFLILKECPKQGHALLISSSLWILPYELVETL